MTTPLEKTDEPALKKSISIKVWGVGGAGCNAVSALDPALLDGVHILAVNAGSRPRPPLPPKNWCSTRHANRRQPISALEQAQRKMICRKPAPTAPRRILSLSCGGSQRHQRGTANRHASGHESDALVLAITL